MWVLTKSMLVLALGWCSNFKDEDGWGSCSWWIILASIQWRPIDLHWWVLHNGWISGADQHHTRHFWLPVVHDWVSIHRPFIILWMHFWLLYKFFFFFLFYSVKIDSNEGFLRTGDLPTLTVLSAGHAMHVFINGQLSGNCFVFTSFKNHKE